MLGKHGFIKHVQYRHIDLFYKALSIKTACLVNDFGSHVPKTVITRNADVNGSSALA